MIHNNLQSDNDFVCFEANEATPRHQTPCQLVPVAGEDSPGKYIGHQQLEQFKPFQTGNHVGQLLDVVSGSASFPYTECDDITTNWDCQDSSSTDFSPHSGVYFIPYSASDCCLGNRATHFHENKHIKRAVSSAFPSAEIPLKMVVGNHHSTQQKLHFSRHLLRKRCFRASSNRGTNGKLSSVMKPNKTKVDKKETLNAKTIVKSSVLRMKPTNVEVLQSSDSLGDDEDGDLSQGDRRQIANARERQRVSHLNEGFDKLRRVLPWMRRSRRVSKVDTLRGAIAYIKYLQQQVWARDLTSGCMDCLGAYCLPRSGKEFVLLFIKKYINMRLINHSQNIASLTSTHPQQQTNCAIKYLYTYGKLYLNLLK